jgi:hypothetical protein
MKEEEIASGSVVEIKTNGVRATVKHKMGHRLGLNKHQPNSTNGMASTQTRYVEKSIDKVELIEA